jgi:hypothetical protein
MSRPNPGKRMPMLGLVRRMPFFKVLAVGQAALLARRHLRRLDPAERRRLGQLVLHAHHLKASERDEVRRLVGKLAPRAFAIAAVNTFSPVRLPRRLAGRTAR